ncbi:MAG TPA: phosphate ABC transporter permease PstA [Treponemataceae bacterium]|nr:phosphate ABC transporter permease PstA [Treponemataceae bacterium]
MKQKTKDGILYGIMILATGIILATLLWILFYIVSNGIGSINFAFIFSPGTEKGIFAMIVTTAWLVAVSLAIALPVGIITALFLNEYSKNTRPVRFLRLAIETLAGIPSILYGLFGLLFFSRIMGLGQSILSGALTLSIMILPVIIRTTEESLKAIPVSFREGSLALGATKWQTIYHVIIPASLPGILTASILAVGRVVGEAAPVLLTVGIAKNLPSSIFQSGRTLTIHLYYLTKEAIHQDDFQIAFTTATILVIFVILVNASTRFIASRFTAKLEQ